MHRASRRRRTRCSGSPVAARVAGSGLHRHPLLRTLVSGAVAILLAAPVHAQRDVPELRARAEAGDAAAQFNLARLHVTGNRRPPRTTGGPPTGTEWRPSRGTPEPSTASGCATTRASGCAEDDAEAARWFRRAADQGPLGGPVPAGSAVRPAATASAATTPRRSAGSAAPPARATPRRSSTSAGCTTTGAGCRSDRARAARLGADGRGAGQSHRAGDPGQHVRDRLGPRPGPSPSPPAGTGLRRGAGRPPPPRSPWAISTTPGPGVPEDDAEAVRWIRRAADQDYAEGPVRAGQPVLQRPRSRAGTSRRRSGSSGSRPSRGTCGRSSTWG